MDSREVDRRMRELMAPVDRQLMMCDSQEDTMMMACAMMQRCFEVFDHHISPQGADSLLLSEINKRMTDRAMQKKYGDRDEYEE